MLVLSRFVDQVIVIEGRDGPILITVVQAYGKVRLGIDAPKDVAVHRLEVYEAIQRERTK